MARSPGLSICVSLFCAWVLWAENTAQKIGGTGWMFFEAFETKDACQKQMVKEFLAITLFSDAEITRKSTELSDQVLFVAAKHPEFGEITRSFKCVPDAVDPRPKK